MTSISVVTFWCQRTAEARMARESKRAREISSSEGAGMAKDGHIYQRGNV
jgi:hypothetical protein